MRKAIYPIFVGLFSLAARCQDTAPFAIHQIARDVQGGYQVVAADINHDGKTDVIGLSQSGDLVWYENPTWTPHVILSESQAQAMIGRPRWHMVNADAADLDGDGVPEIALAYGFDANAPQSTGNIGILHSGDSGKTWTLTEIGRVPTAHRVRFANIFGHGRKDLLVAPVLNRAETGGLANPGHLPVPLFVFHRTEQGWQHETITQENMGLVHAVQPFDWYGEGHDAVLTAGFSGIALHRLVDGRWSRIVLSPGDTGPWPAVGAGEVAAGAIAGKRFFATIEHFHGTMVVVYLPAPSGGWQRHVIDSGLITGHALLVAAFDGDGRPEIVAAGDGSRANLFYYKMTDATGQNWARTLMDDNMAASSCALADMDGDGRPDVVCMDNRKPNYIKWYRLN